MIVPFGLEHVDSVAKLHCAALTGLLSELGESAARAFYTGCVRSRAAIGFVNLEQGAVNGFVLGSIHPNELKKAVVCGDSAGTLAGVFLGILRRPAALARLIQSFMGPDEGNCDPREPELTYLAVAAGCRESGVGGELVNAFTQAMRDAAVSAYELSVDDDNEAAAAFYIGRGFAPIGHYREFGVWHRRYRLTLSSSPTK